MTTTTTPRPTAKELLRTVAEAEYGGSVDEMLEHYSIDSVVAGICTTCKAIEPSCEPDADDIECEDCETPTVKSVLIIAGLI